MICRVRRSLVTTNRRRGPGEEPKSGHAEYDDLIHPKYRMGWELQKFGLFGLVRVCPGEGASPLAPRRGAAHGLSCRSLFSDSSSLSNRLPILAVVMLQSDEPPGSPLSCIHNASK